MSAVQFIARPASLLQEHWRGADPCKREDTHIISKGISFPSLFSPFLSCLIPCGHVFSINIPVNLVLFVGSVLRLERGDAGISLDRVALCELHMCQLPVRRHEVARQEVVKMGRGTCQSTWDTYTSTHAQHINASYEQVDCLAAVRRYDSAPTNVTLGIFLGYRDSC
jgi:hypothetical protein